MSWTALVPLKAAGERKRRLSQRLSPVDRAALARRLFCHVVNSIATTRAVEHIVVLSDVRPADRVVEWIRDRGRGLNVEVQAAADRLVRPLLIVHADLPLLESRDLDALIEAAEACGAAVAPDRHRSGTNAVALADARNFAFHFGPGSLAHHQAGAGRSCRLVERLGLQLDCDTSEDLDLAFAAGFVA
jgi:2-phospho-L-lactate guanylyltransferase